MEAQSVDLIRRCILENYAINATLSRLPGENLNYLAVVKDDEKYVVKIVASDQDESLIDMEFKVLKWARESLYALALPQIQENKFGQIQSFYKDADNSDKQLRIIEYLLGDLLEHADISDQIRFNIGKALAEFDRAVLHFDHPAAHRNHRWDLMRANQHSDILELISDPQKLALLSWAYEQYTKSITGNIEHINWQFIHGDANPENILIDGQQVVGLLDFGDSCFNPRICELAICLPYLMMDQADPFAVACSVIEGYKTISPLSVQELNLLWPLILGRLATTISVATERRELDPDHPNWFVSEERAWSLLEQLRDIPNPFL